MPALTSHYPAQIEESAPSPGRTTRRVLVADDEAPVRMLVSKLLERAGYEVITAKHGGEILATIAANPVDLLVTDIVMPETEGIETIVRLRRSHPALPIIAMSGDNPLGTDVLAMASLLGARRVIRKPFECEALLALVKEVLPAQD